MDWFCTLLIVGSDLHHSSGIIGNIAADTVCFVQPCVGAVDVRLAVLAAQHCPFGEYGHAVKSRRPGSADGGIRQNAVVEGHVDAVVVAVKSHRLDGGLLRLENFRRRFHRFRHRSHHYHLHRRLLQS